MWAKLFQNPMFVGRQSCAFEKVWFLFGLIKGVVCSNFLKSICLLYMIALTIK